MSRTRWKRREGRGPRRPWLRVANRRTQLIADLIALSIAFVGAYLLRFDFRIPQRELQHMAVQLPMAVLIEFAVMIAGGVYDVIWRYIGLAEALRIGRAFGLSALPLLTFRLAFDSSLQAWRVPVSVIIINAGLAFGLVLLLRILRRLLYERFERPGRNGGTASRTPRRALCVGAGRAGKAIVEALRAHPDASLKVVALVDDDPHKQGFLLAGLRVAGTTADIPRIAREKEADLVIIAISSTRGAQIRRIVDLCNAARLTVRIVPAIHELAGAPFHLSHLRKVAIGDLLGRAPVEVDLSRLRTSLSGKRVLITGGGGSIGRELARQALGFEPDHLWLVDQSEFNLFDALAWLSRNGGMPKIDPVVADVRDTERMGQLLRRLQPDVIFHAAAHKHVPLMENNICEAVANNAFASEGLMRLAAEEGVEAFVLISTDKAVNPASVMGATKRLAELLLLQEAAQSSCRALAVRFGNVLGSRGSVVPIFEAQIAAGGPVTVTHPQMKRFFMMISEAVQLVLQAAVMGTGGEVFVLDMGEPVAIDELARQMIRLSGLRPNVDIRIEYCGCRPGERLEEFLYDERIERLEATEHPKINVIRPVDGPPQPQRDLLERLRRAVAEQDDDQARRLLFALVTPPPGLPIAPLSVRHPDPAAAGVASQTEGALTASKARLDLPSPRR